MSHYKAYPQQPASQPQYQYPSAQYQQPSNPYPQGGVYGQAAYHAVTPQQQQQAQRQQYVANQYAAANQYVATHAQPVSPNGSPAGSPTGSPPGHGQVSPLAAAVAAPISQVSQSYAPPVPSRQTKPAVSANPFQGKSFEEIMAEGQRLHALTVDAFNRVQAQTATNRSIQQPSYPAPYPSYTQQHAPQQHLQQRPQLTDAQRARIAELDAQFAKDELAMQPIRQQQQQVQTQRQALRTQVYGGRGY